MKIHADRSRRAVVRWNEVEWVDSPLPGGRSVARADRRPSSPFSS